MAWSRSNPDNIYLGDDGGIKKSTTGPNGALTATGISASGGIGNSQFYTFDIAPDNVNYRYGGLQDNGAKYTANGGTTWNNFVGGDGEGIRVDYGDPNIVIGGSQYGVWSISKARGANPVAFVGNYTQPYPTQRKVWDAGLAIDKVNGFYYVGSQYVWRGTRGNNSPVQISTDLTNGDHSASANYPMGTVGSLSAFNGVVFAGTDDGNVWVNKAANTGTVWTKIRNGNGTGPGTNERSFDGWVKHLTPDESVADGSSVFVVVSYFRWGDKYWKPSAYRLTNFGVGGPGSADWKDITGDLPPHININKVVKDAKGFLYAATDYGPYYSTNGGVNWSWLGNRNLPIVPINDMLIHQATNTLYIGTYGRGMWRYPLAEVTSIEGSSIESMNPSAQILNILPNPVTTLARIKVQVNQPQNLYVALYDFSGRLVKVVMNKPVKAGKPYALTWNRTDEKGRSVQPGNYLMRAIGDKVTLARKIIVQ
jgi:hypothetical protein